jgi:hypothetical protein
MKLIRGLLVFTALFGGAGCDPDTGPLPVELVEGGIRREGGLLDTHPVVELQLGNLSRGTIQSVDLSVAGFDQNWNGDFHSIDDRALSVGRIAANETLTAEQRWDFPWPDISHAVIVVRHVSLEVLAPDGGRWASSCDETATDETACPRLVVCQLESCDDPG